MRFVTIVWIREIKLAKIIFLCLILKFEEIFPKNTVKGKVLECSTGFQNFSLDRILSHDDTAGGISLGVA